MTKKQKRPPRRTHHPRRSVHIRPRKRAHFRSAKAALPKKVATLTAGRYISTDPPTITIANGRVVMMVPKPLKSLNKRGGFWAEHGERRAWEQILADCPIVSDLSVARPVTGRRRLEIVRLAPSRRYLLDKTNLDACGKRLEDALVALGYLLDDDRFGVEGPFITQGVSSDKCYWAIVTISEAQPYVDDIRVLSAKDLAAQALDTLAS